MRIVWVALCSVVVVLSLSVFLLPAAPPTEVETIGRADVLSFARLQAVASPRAADEIVALTRNAAYDGQEDEHLRGLVREIIERHAGAITVDLANAGKPAKVRK